MLSVRLTLVYCLQASSKSSSSDPLQMSSLPPEPWHTGFLCPIFTGDYLFIVIDAYSRFPLS